MLPLPMVGRSDELAEIAQAWSDLPGTVVITGEAGCGKSMLVRAAVAALDPPPVLVLSGRARVHAPAPYDWLAATLSAHRIDQLPIPADALAWLAQQPAPPRRRYAPGALLRLAVRTVRALAEPGPATIVVEDLHALDPASINLVTELATAADLPALLLVTSRPPETALAPRLTEAALAQLAGAPGAIRQRLGALATAEVAALLEQRYGAAAPPEAVGVVHERTGGNPYRLTELLAATNDANWRRAALPPPRDGKGAHQVGGDPARAGSRRAALPPPRSGERAREMSGDPARSGPAAARPEPGQPPIPPPSPELTAREVEVLSCLAAGMSNKQVARALGISIRTVTVHVSNLLRKTHSSSRTEAALWAVRHHLVSP